MIRETRNYVVEHVEQTICDRRQLSYRYRDHVPILEPGHGST